PERPDEHRADRFVLACRAPHALLHRLKTREGALRGGPPGDQRFEKGAAWRMIAHIKPDAPSLLAIEIAMGEKLAHAVLGPAQISSLAPARSQPRLGREADASVRAIGAVVALDLTNMAVLVSLDQLLISAAGRLGLIQPQPRQSRRPPDQVIEDVRQLEVHDGVRIEQEVQ